MKLTEQQNLLIQEYLSDKLSDAHQVEFDEQVKDPNFRKSLWVQANVLNELQEGHDETLRKQIEGFGKDTPISSATSTPTNTWLKYAALLIVIVGAIFLFKTILPSQTEEDNQALFAKHYQAYPAQDISRGGDDQSIALQVITDAYIKGDFELTLEKIENGEYNDNAEIYKLISLIELGRLDEAIAVTSKLKQSQSASIQDVAEWYEILILVRQDKSSNAISKSKAYINGDRHLFQKELESLLRDLTN